MRVTLPGNAPPLPFDGLCGIDTLSNPSLKIASAGAQADGGKRTVLAASTIAVAASIGRQTRKHTRARIER
jgi:hypothetical protein